MVSKKGGSDYGVLCGDPTPIMPDHRLVLCFFVVVQPSHGGL
jgi:hypothetical protein